MNQHEQEQDCTDQLLECTTECDPQDKECETECVEDYKGCETMVHVDQGEIISELLTLTSLLNGKMERRTVYDSTGRSSKKIIIEYDIKERDKRPS
tara:strand:- start:359 stop:646 length:288 start_codon:yes stop_codon:yes gene_type:complete